MGILEAIDARLTVIEQMLADFQKNQPRKEHLLKESDLVTIDKACEITHLSRDRLYAIHHKLFNTTKPGKKLLFPAKELLAYAAGNLEPKQSVLAKEVVEHAADKIRAHQWRRSSKAVQR